MIVPGERNRWLAALLVTALLLAAAYAVSDVVFQTNDDNAIVSAASGGVTGAPYAGNGFTSYLYGALLAGLYGALPGVPWHALLLTAAQAVSLIALCRSALYLCAKNRVSPLWGIVGFAALYAGVGVKFMVYLQFTATPGYCAAALAALLWTLSEGKRARIFCCALGFGVMAFGLLLRFKGGLLALPVPLLAGVFRALSRDGRGKAALTCCAAVLIFTLGAWALDGALYRANEPGWREQAAFDEASATLLDYHNDDETYALALQATDWSPELIRCIRGWNLFIDERFDTENLTRLAEAIEQNKSAPSALLVLKKTGSVLKRYQEFRWNALALGLMGLWALLTCLRARCWREALLLAFLAGSLLAVIALFYGLLNRLPDRVAFAYAWPVYALTLLLWLGTLEEGVGRLRLPNPSHKSFALMYLTFGPPIGGPIKGQGRSPCQGHRGEPPQCVEKARAAAQSFPPILAGTVCPRGQTPRPPGKAGRYECTRRGSGPSEPPHLGLFLPLALLVLAAVVTLATAWGDTLVPREGSVGRQSRAALSERANAYAAAHPECVYVTDVTQGFYAFSAERPPVNLLEWGSAMIRSPMYRRKMAALGYPDGFTSRNLADEDVRVLLAGGDTLALLMDCVHADIADWNAVVEDDQGLFRVYRLE